jgi:ABC-type transporter Mla MlaB component
MALQISKKNGTYVLSGNLNTNTSRSFIIHFEYLINTLNYVTVNIDKVKEIDVCGVESLKTLIAISLRNNSRFYIIGNGSKDIYEHQSVSFAA